MVSTVDPADIENNNSASSISMAAIIGAAVGVVAVVAVAIAAARMYTKHHNPAVAPGPLAGAAGVAFQTIISIYEQPVGDNPEYGTTKFNPTYSDVDTDTESTYGSIGPGNDYLLPVATGAAALYTAAQKEGKAIYTLATKGGAAVYNMAAAGVASVYDFATESEYSMYTMATDSDDSGCYAELPGGLLGEDAV